MIYCEFTRNPSLVNKQSHAALLSRPEREFPLRHDSLFSRLSLLTAGAIAPSKLLRGINSLVSGYDDYVAVAGLVVEHVVGAVAAVSLSANTAHPS